MKYIDADKLLVKIKSLQCEQGFEDGEAERGYQLAIKDILDIIDTLQQEMELPDKYQIPDWIWRKVTIDQLAEEYVEGVKKCNDAPTLDLIHTAVCYGFELGLIERKED